MLAYDLPCPFVQMKCHEKPARLEVYSHRRLAGNDQIAGHIDLDIATAHYSTCQKVGASACLNDAYFGDWN